MAMCTLYPALKNSKASDRVKVEGGKVVAPGLTIISPFFKKKKTERLSPVKGSNQFFGFW